MSYELIQDLQYLIETEKGDTERLKFILGTIKKGKQLYNSDREYLENLLHSVKQERDQIPTDHTNYGDRINDIIYELRNDLRILKKDFDEIKSAQDKNKYTLKTGSEIKTTQVEDKWKKASIKNEDISLVLSIVLGLVGLSGIGQIYLGKIAKGVGILALSFILLGSGIFILINTISDSQILPTISSFIMISFLVGYLGLYVYQIFDARKMCRIYNEYVQSNGQKPYWW